MSNMKKKGVSPIELKKIVELRQIDTPWTEIERETKVERRIAKRAYDEWERDQKMDEQEKVRFRVAAEAFHEHMNGLIRLAEALSNHLSLPIGPDEARSADQNISNLWQTSILEESNLYAQSQAERVRQIRSNERLNLMIFKSLQTHTGEKLRWHAFDEWKEAWDNCRVLFNNLKIEGRSGVTNILNEEADLLQEIEKRSQKEDAIQRIARATVYAIWESVVENKFDSRSPRVKVSYELVDRTVAIFTEKELIESLIALCDKALEKLLNEDTVSLVKQLYDEVHNLRKAMDELAEMLNKLVLYPIILYTRCDLCPA
jgi:hypothetical protein